MFDKTQVDWLLKALGNIEEPLGVFYTDTKPKNGFGPKDDSGHECVMKFIRLARTRKAPGWISGKKTGCLGGGVYSGYILPPPESVTKFVTTGLPGQDGERYMPEPASMVSFLNALELQPASGEYCVFKPLSQFQINEAPLAVIFFARGEVLTGLCQLAYFSFNDHEGVVFPFGSGCASILAWPFYYQRKQQKKAVVGGADPSCRPYMETDELSYTVSGSGFATMLEKAPESFLTTHTWQNVLKKIARSQRVWAR